jgi:hypothetical protein
MEFFDRAKRLAEMNGNETVMKVNQLRGIA